MQRPAKPFTPVRFRIQPPNNMKIGIIGYGFVGKSLHRGLNDSVTVMNIDPLLENNIEDLSNFNPNVIFICVPTPMNEDKSQDITIIKSVIDEILHNNIDSLIVLKSTVLPNHIKEIQNLIPRFVYNPEFLREKHADEDFIKSNLIVFGGNPENTHELAKIYKEYTKCMCKEYIHTDATAASLIKYTINSFLSLKVIFFNELKSLFDESGSNESWSNFVDSLSRDIRIGSSHMQVPGHDGRLGYGGACLPKDANALNEYSIKLKNKLNLLDASIKINNQLRSFYDSETQRELDQNIKFTVDDNN